MSWRTVVISSRCKLDYRMGYMVVRGDEIKRVFIDEIAVLIIENPAVSFTGCLMEILVEKKVKVIFCDNRRNPISELIPHHGSRDSSLKIRTQALWNREIKNAVWTEIVSEKLRKQAGFLNELGKAREYELLTEYISQIEFADTSNREGHAAKVYFNALFGMHFTRSGDNPINAALNYGYSIILSVFNREISANGYLTQLGIFHDNMFNHFNLSCDLMEPFRIIVDRCVYNLKPADFDKEEKHEILKLLNSYVMIDNTRQVLINAIKVYTRSVFDAINDEDTSKICFYDYI